MIYKVIYTTENDDKKVWCMSKDGGVTRVIVETPIDGNQPSDILCARMQKENTSEMLQDGANPKLQHDIDWMGIMKKNAANKDRVKKERSDHNKRTTRDYRLKD